MSSNEHTPESPDSALSETQRRVQAELRAVAPPAARESFRSQLRREFVSGDIEARAEEEIAAPGRRRISTRRWLQWSVPLAAAAALLFMFAPVNHGMAWEVAQLADGMGTVELDGKLYSCDDLSPIQAALHPGCKVVVPAGGRMEVRDEGNLLLQLNGGVAVTLPSAGNRFSGSTLESEFRGEGTLRVTTGDRFAGTRYRIRSEALDLTVTGTTFTVIQRAGETCICVLDGEVVATMTDGSTRSIAAGRRLTIDRQTGEFEEGEMRPNERGELEDLRGRADHLG